MENYYKKCDGCNEPMYYSDKYKLQRSINNGSVCYSCSNKKRIISPETRQKMSTWIRTGEIKSKISDSLKNHKCHKLKIGIPRSKNTKNNISKTLSGRVLSKVHASNISKSLTGRRLSKTHIDNSMAGREKSTYKRKCYNLGSEKVMLQGYEYLTIDKLISENLLPHNIKVNVKDKPKIQYSWNGKNHYYYPDCYLPDTNTIVETKSDWTWKCDIDRNIAKITATQQEGYDVRVVIWNGKKKLVSDTTYNKES